MENPNITMTQNKPSNIIGSIYPTLQELIGYGNKMFWGNVF